MRCLGKIGLDRGRVMRGAGLAVAVLAGCLWAAPSRAEKGLTVSEDQPLRLAESSWREKSPQRVAEVLAGQRQVASAAWWGFDAENATESVQAAIASGASTVVIPRMDSDWVIEPVFLVSHQTLLFEEGVVVAARRGAFQDVADILFSARGQQDLRLIGHGATLRMHRDDYASEAYQNPRSEWRHTLALFGCANVLVAGLTLEGSGGDGIYIGSGVWRRPGYGPFDPDLPKYSRDIVIRDVVCEGHLRQGISVITAENLLIERTTLRNTGGAKPEAGIDFEPNGPNDRLIHIRMRDCVLEGNAGSGIEFHFGKLNREVSPPVSLFFERVASHGNRGPDVRFSSNLTRPTAPEGVIHFDANCQFDMSRVRLGLPPDGGRTLAWDTPEHVQRARELTASMDIRFDVPVTD